MFRFNRHMDCVAFSEQYPLLGVDEAPPVEIINPNGTARILLLADHASNRIPRCLDGLGLDEETRQQHIAWDIGSDRVVRHLSRLFDAPAVIAGYSRLLIDLNRSLSDPTSIPVISAGIRIPGNENLDKEQHRLRVHSLFTPYRRAIDSLRQQFQGRDIIPSLIAIHSFTPNFDGDPRPWQIGILWDKDPRIPVPLMEQLAKHPDGIAIGDNLPYSGKHTADYTIDHHAEANGLPHVSIEFRQDLVDTEAGAEKWAGIIHEALLEVLARPGINKLWQAEQVFADR